MISIKPKHFKRYAAITRLLFKYGRGDVARQAGLPDVIEDDDIEYREGQASPDEFARDLEKLGPTYIKFGQLLSTRADLLPRAYLQSLTRLQDDVEPMPATEVRDIIARELGVRISKAFASFEEQPVAAASLGQVHRATLKDGREVALKVQRSGVREQIVDDLDALKELAELLDRHTEFGRRLGLVGLVQSLERAMLNELDFRQEAENTRRLREALKPFDQLRVPEVYDDLVTSRLLTMEYIQGTKITDVHPSVLIELDGNRLAQELFRAYLHQILADGHFHSDPHPGNILLTRDREIALIDAGMVTRTDPAMQKRLLKLMLAICDRAGEEAARSAIEIGMIREDFDEAGFVAEIAHLVASHHGKTLDELSAGRLVMDIQSAAGRFGLGIPTEVNMLGKTLLNLDEVLAVLDPDFDPNAALRELATELLQKHTEKKLTLNSLYQVLVESADLAQNLPSRVNRITELAASNNLRLRIDLDERRIVAGFEKVANRITTGLVLAALIVGASLMMQMESTLTLFGMPAIALVFFFLAASFGSILVARALFGGDRR